MNESKKKYLVLLPVVIIIIAFLISLVIYPVTQLSPKEIPIAIASLDKGAATPAGEMNLGNEIVSKVSGVKNNAIKWISLDSQADVDKGFKNEDFYASIVIPEDFTAKQMTAQAGQGEADPMVVTIDQGQSPQIAAVTTQVISKMTEQTGMTPTIDYLNPVDSDMQSGTAYIFVFIMTWITALVGSIILFLYQKDAKEIEDRNALLKKRLIQICAALISSFIIGLTVAFIASTVLGLAIPFMNTAMFITIASFCFMMMIVGVMSWTGIGGIAIFILIMCFGLIASNMPYEMLPEFWQNWIYPWIPLRFGSEGIANIFYMDGGVWSGDTAVLCWIGAGGLALLLLSALRLKKPGEVNSVSESEILR